eukprot:31499-Pelagococcus_subviridis.AAC.29
MLRKSACSRYALGPFGPFGFGPRNTSNTRAFESACFLSVLFQYSVNCAHVTGAGSLAGAVGAFAAFVGSSSSTSIGSVPCIRCITSGAKYDGSSHTSLVTLLNASASSASPSKINAASASFVALCSSPYASLFGPK